MMKALWEIGKVALAVLLVVGVLLAVDGLVPKSHPTESPWAEFWVGVILCALCGLPLGVITRREKARKRDANQPLERTR